MYKIAKFHTLKLCNITIQIHPTNYIFITKL
nr:MAG TPA: hypothetical protein [Caudoviricetes sp.]